MAGHAGSQVAALDAIVVSIQTADGLIGFGDSMPAPHFTGEDWGTVVRTIKNGLAQSILGLNVFGLEEIHTAMDKAFVEGTNPSAKAALDMACFDLMGKYTNQPVHQLLGGAFRSQVQQVPEIVLDTIPNAVRRSQEAVAQGDRTLKIKVSGDPKFDVELVKRIRDAVGDDIALTVDGNQGWKNYWTALQVGKQIEECNIEVLEQPIRAHDFKGHAELRMALDMPIMLDESACSLKDALTAIEMEACDIISVKLMKCGGLWRARQLVNFCQIHGIPCHMGTMWETQLGWAANLHCIAALPNICLWDAYSPSGIYWGIEASIGTPIKTTLHEGIRMVEVPQGPGLGITVDQEALKKHLLEQPSIIQN
jgi:L-alanine-DL-glutamate epimerase-like enolase superfamily enzyme